MNRRTIFVAIYVCAFLCALPLWSQQAAKAQPDNLLLNDGERLIGQVTGGDSSTLEFHSDLVGDVKVKWSDVQELHTNQKLAIIPKGVKLRRREVGGIAPQGTVSATAEALTVTRDTGQVQTQPVTNVAHIVDAPTFARDIAHNLVFSKTGPER